MSSYNWLNVTQKEIMDTIESPINKKITASLFNVFLSNGLRIKTRAEYMPNDLLPLHGYTVYFYVKGSKETIILNTFFFKIQLRINNRSTLDKLDDYSENIRNAILTAAPCKACPNREGIFTGHGEYIFTYHGKEYRKCQTMCTNFKIQNLNECDIDSLIDIINHEISFMKPNLIK
ncbi:hypothetical protein I5677_14685 [Mobilitalea sibirica]|uniref:Uncharacterized protein n=1 Tax=Mobilitalea sibirica TaxID=1462919 RepID=A0A8J7HCJ4_9FIRM|nr:hypothetical protein [Mobilitalea sibirica]MBH1942146.1 hypothetical protein [Mobilitalea sibirica]